MEINVKEMLKPTKVLEIGPVKIHLQGVDSAQYYFIESIKGRTFTSQEEAEKSSFEYFSRMVKSCVKKVEGITINGQDWDITLTPDGKEMTSESYEFLREILDRLIIDYQANVAKEIMAFFAESKMKRLQSIEFKTDDKKKI